MERRTDDDREATADTPLPTQAQLDLLSERYGEFLQDPARRSYSLAEIVAGRRRRP